MTLGADVFLGLKVVLKNRGLRLRATIKAFLALIRADTFPDVEDVLGMASGSDRR